MTLISQPRRGNLNHDEMLIDTGPNYDLSALWGSPTRGPRDELSCLLRPLSGEVNYLSFAPLRTLLLEFL